MTGLVSIVIVASLVLVIAIPMKLPEIVYLLAYAQDSREIHIVMDTIEIMKMVKTTQ